MPEYLSVSLAVIVAVALLAAVLLLAMRRRSRVREEALAAYCRQRGYDYQREVLPRGLKITVGAEGWTVFSEMERLRNDANTGSDNVVRRTAWRSDEPARPAFILGSAPSAANFDTLPEWMRSAALQKIKAEWGIALGPDAPHETLRLGGADYLLFSDALADSREKVRSVEDALAAAARGGRALVRCGPDGTIIELQGIFLRDDAALDALVNLGRAFIGKAPSDE